MPRAGPWICVPFVWLAACGYIGDPLPPSLRIPRAAADFSAAQVGAWIEVHFTLPDLTTDGVVLDRLAAVDLRIGEDTAATPDAWAASAERISVPRDTVGPTQVRIPAQAWAGKRVRLGVRSQSARGKWSDWSTLVRLEVVPNLTPPAELTAVSDPRGVRLSWRRTGPASSVRIFRRSSAQDPFVEVALTGEDAWIDEDASPDQSYQYQVASLRQAGGHEARSERSEVVAITVRDTFPPSVPANLNAIAGVGTIELAWDRSPERDAAGYHVYRAEPNGSLSKISGVAPGASFSDPEVQSGKAYQYAVTAVDLRGNESAPSATVNITLP